MPAPSRILMANLNFKFEHAERKIARHYEIDFCMRPCSKRIRATWQDELSQATMSKSN